MPTEKPRYTIVVDEELMKRIDDFRFENRYPSRSAATLELLNYLTKDRRNRKRQEGKIPQKFRYNPHWVAARSVK